MMNATSDEPFTIELSSIGHVETPYSAPEGVPIQSVVGDSEGRVVLRSEFIDCLDDLDGFERIWLLYCFHQSPRKLRKKLVPFLDDVERGVFATRSPVRPNPIGMSCVTLLSRKDNILTVGGIDLVDGTPLLDIKPYVPRFDAHLESRAGWFDAATSKRKRADDRFTRG